MSDNGSALTPCRIACRLIFHCSIWADEEVELMDDDDDDSDVVDSEDEDSNGNCM